MKLSYEQGDFLARGSYECIREYRARPLELEGARRAVRDYNIGSIRGGRYLLGTNTDVTTASTRAAELPGRLR